MKTIEMTQPSIKPTFDSDGYPTDETENTIAMWHCIDSVEWFKYIHAAWNNHYGRMWIDQEDGFLKMATGGWSGNESIIAAMISNYVLWGYHWKSSHRGGLYVFDIKNATKSFDFLGN